MTPYQTKVAQNYIRLALQEAREARYDTRAWLGRAVGGSSIFPDAKWCVARARECLKAARRWEQAAWAEIAKLPLCGRPRTGSLRQRWLAPKSALS